MGNGEDEGDAKVPESLSQFLARVLAQLSVTAWLPALALVGIVLILAQVSRKEGSLPEAFSAIGDMGFSAILLLVAGVVVSSIFTQAFEFAVIRLIEGYWPLSGPVGVWGRRRIRRHLAKREALIGDLQSVRRSAAESARPRLRDQGHGSGVFDAFESKVANLPMPDGLSVENQTKGSDLADQWKTFADPALVQQVEGVERRINEYPELEHRVLPTRLGNIIRAVEDQVHDPASGRLETFVLHLFDDLPRPTAWTFLENRRRLNLYCGQVVVFGGAVVPSVVLGRFYDDDYWAVGIGLPLAIACLTLLSYRAALASSRTYGLALVAIKEHRDRRRATPPMAGPEAGRTVATS